MSSSGILSQEMELRGLPAGWYNLRVEAADRAGNRSYVSRNFLKQAAAEAQRVELYYPADGESLAGPFSVSGRVVAQALPENVLVTMDGQPLETVPLGPEGWFRLEVEAAALAAGPWFDEEVEQEKDALAKLRAERKVRLVELSMDNGRSFHKADGREAWRFRLETQELASGLLRLLVRATFENEGVAVSRTQLTVDTRAPEVRLLEPSEGGRFNASLQVLGTGLR